VTENGCIWLRSPLPLPVRHLLMVGTLSSFPAWLDLYQFNVVNYNDAMIFYMFRHLLMAVLFIVAAILYTTRNYPFHGWRISLL
jgi:hypothetical protein